MFSRVFIMKGKQFYSALFDWLTYKIVYKACYFKFWVTLTTERRVVITFKFVFVPAKFAFGSATCPLQIRDENSLWVS